MVYVNNIFPTEYVVCLFTLALTFSQRLWCIKIITFFRVFDNHDATIMYNEKQLKLTLWDTAVRS
jgi:hypothetical protein